MSKKLKIVLFVAAVTIVLLLCYSLIKSFFAVEDNYTITTKCGDVFKVRYHTFQCESHVTSPNSNLNWHHGGRINKDDFVLLDKTDFVTVYVLKGSIIFNDGNGFEEFDGENIDEKPEVANRVKEVLLSDYSVYSSNFDFFLKSRTYKQEANQIIDYIKHEKLDKLSQYGLTEDVINDRYTLDLIKKSINNL